jgi:hypothetical protein
MDAVRSAPADVPGGTADPLYRFGHGLDVAAGSEARG